MAVEGEAPQEHDGRTDRRGDRQRSSIDEQEQELGVRCFAMSVPGAPSPLAISVSGPISRVDDDFAARAIPLLRSVAEQIAADMQPGA